MSSILSNNITKNFRLVAGLKNCLFSIRNQDESPVAISGNKGYNHNTMSNLRKTIKNWRRAVVRRICPKTYTWRMTDEEQAMFKKYLRGARHYLEFGAGGSTVCALKHSDADITSVESSKGFIRHLKRNPAMAFGGVRFRWSDIGATGDWGRPKDESKKDLWPNYSADVFREQGGFDVVLVDGRFRVACGLQTVLNTDDDTIIMIHDFYNRPEYHILLKYLEPVEEPADTLGVFRKKKGIDPARIESDYEKYKYDFA